MERYILSGYNTNVLLCIRTVSTAVTAAVTTYGTEAIIENGDISNTAGPIYGYHYGKSFDTIMLPFGSFSAKRSSVQQIWHQFRFTTANSITTLKGISARYPDWSIATTAVIDALYQASEDHLGHGRGLYVGSTTRRYNAPVLVPGSGTFLDEVLGDLSQHIDYDSSAPQPLPYMPAEPMFASSHTQYFPNDHGGPLAYCGFGIAMRPSSDEYKNQVVMQISGGPTGGTYSGKFTPNDLAGTAIDAFWPTGRPVLKSRK